MNKLFRSVLNYLRGNTIRSYLYFLPDHGRIWKELKIEDLRHELSLMDLHSRQLSIEQKRVEHMLTDLTRCIRGLEFDMKTQATRKTKKSTKSKPDDPPSDKKSHKVGDFRESKNPRGSPPKRQQQRRQ